MPIDHKKFKQVVTNHFNNLTEEEFLKTLHKSSPYLFDENAVEKQDIPLLERDETNSLNTFVKLSPIDEEFREYLIEEVDRMKLNNVDSVTIQVYLFKQELVYKLVKIFQSTIYLADKVTKFFTKRA